MSLLASLNGALLPLDEARVSVLDRGFMFGDGAYEVIRLYRARPFLLDEHLARLLRSLTELRIDAIDPAWLATEAHRVIAASSVSEGSLYIQVTRGAPPIRAHAFPHQPIQNPPQNPFEDAFPTIALRPTTFVYAMPLTTDYSDKRRTGCAAITFPDLRWSRCDIKSINLLGNVFAAQAATESGVYESILLRDQVVTEGSHTNVFAVIGSSSDMRLCTMPPTHQILAGITRAHILTAAHNARIPIEERPLPISEFRSASEAFLTGTTTEVMPLVTLDNHPIGDGRPGPVTRRLQESYDAEIAAFACAP